MVKLSRGNPKEGRGLWKPTKTDKGDTAIVSCPKCGMVFTIGSHYIHPIYSQVSPRVHCPVACGFVDTIHLSGWTSRNIREV